MTYNNLFNIKQLLGNMLITSLKAETRLKCYDFLDFAEDTFMALNKNRAKQYSLPINGGNIDFQKYLDDKKKELKRGIGKEAEAKAADEAAALLNTIMQALKEEDDSELSETKTMPLNFMSIEEFSSIIKPREIKSIVPDGFGGSRSEKQDWFLTADQERFLRRYLVKK